jgi:phytoene dehydrogenase-like protein
MSAQAFDVVVIGGGANGLVAACRLGKAGRRVLVLERSESAGGQGSVIEFAPGFHAAPLGIDPGWVPPKIVGALGLSGLEPITADTALTVAVGPREFLTLWSDPARAPAAIAPHSKSDAAAWPAFTTLLATSRGSSRCSTRSAPGCGRSLARRAAPVLSLGGSSAVWVGAT